MKNFTLKGLLAITMLFLAFIAYAQHGPHALPGSNQGVCFSKDYTAIPTDNINSVFTEDFTSGCPPTGWAVVGLGETNWQPSATNNAGGTAPEGMLNWQPQFVGNSKLVSPAINTTGYDVLALEFKQYVNDYGGGYDLKVETTSDGSTWNEVYSVAVNGSIGPETKLLLIDNGDVGSANFKLAFTLDGDSYQINYWYLDDVVLFQAANLDAAVAAVYIPSIIPTGNTVTPSALVRNMGTETVSFNVTFKILQGGSAVYTGNYNVTNLAGFQSQLVTFNNWTAVQGTYTAEVTVTLAGDENPTNNVLTKDFQVLDNLVMKKPLYEEFTSSTCGPCALANPVIDGVLADNPDEYSLIKYQMNWPGSGDIYYTQQGGDRRDYYGCSWVPDLYANSTQIVPAESLTQVMFDQFADAVTAVELIADANIDENMMITVNLNINSTATYAAGLKAHIVVVEKVTVGNVSSNGETEFHNVMMTMLPGSSGTTLGALTPGTPVNISETFDMSTTNMEEPTDLRVIVFVQDDTDKSIIQSDMIDVEAGNFDTYAVNFNVIDSDGNPVEGATITLEGHPETTTNASGQATYPEVFPGTFAYEITKGGLEGASGTIEVVDQDVTVNATLQIPDYYYYEDFEAGLPDNWTTVFSGWNSVYWYGGQVIVFRQEATGEIWLISPSIDLSLAETLTIQVGNNTGTPSPTMVVGTVPDPSNTAAFTELASVVPPTSGFEDFDIDLTAYTGTDSYIAITYNGPDFGYFYIELFKMTARGGSGGGSLITETYEDYNAGQQLALQANAMGRDYWTTWSNAPGGAEDPMVSNASAHNGSNSMVIEGSNDCVLLLGNKTTGKYSLNFYVNIPTGFYGYFNVLQDFAGANSAWGTQAYFDAGGVGTVDAGGAGAGTFTYSYDTWNFVEVVVDLDADWAEFYVNGADVVQWQWSLGTFGTPGLVQLSAANFYAWSENGTPKAYFDDVDFKEVTSALLYEPFEAYTAGEKLVQQSVNMGLDYWTTWSNSPGSAEDPFVSSEQAHAGANSMVCQGTNDAVILFGDKTTGKYSVNFYIYIPTGKVGYYNILQSFNGANSVWGSEVYFNPNGTALITANGTAGIASFSYAYDEWLYIENIIDLNSDQASIRVNGTEYYTWQWSVGAQGGGINQLGAMDIYAATTNGTPYFFLDDIELKEFLALAAPTNLVATVNDNDITLTWNAPATDGFLGFNVYRGTQIIAQQISALTFTDYDLLPGTYTYDVKAVYDEGYSSGAGPVDATIAGGTAREMVVVEIGTGTWCQYCPGAAMGADELTENGQDVAIVEYHSGDAYETNESGYRATTYYAITGFPTAFFDGTLSIVGGSTTQSMYASYLPLYETRAAKVSLFELSIEPVYLGGTSFNLTVNANNIYPYPGNSLVLQVICTESHIPVSWYGMTEVNFVCRKMMPDHLGTAMDFNSQPNQSVTLPLDYGTWDVENCQAVAFIQDNDTKEILQATRVDLGQYVGINNPQEADLSIFPNPATEMINISGSNNVSLVKIINNNGQVVFEQQSDAPTLQVNTSVFAKGVYLIEIYTNAKITTRKLVIR